MDGVDTNVLQTCRKHAVYRLYQLAARVIDPFFMQSSRRQFIGIFLLIWEAKGGLDSMGFIDRWGGRVL